VCAERRQKERALDTVGGSHCVLPPRAPASPSPGRSRQGRVDVRDMVGRDKSASRPFLELPPVPLVPSRCRPGQMPRPAGPTTASRPVRLLPVCQDGDARHRAGLSSLATIPGTIGDGIGRHLWVRNQADSGTVRMKGGKLPPVGMIAGRLERFARSRNSFAGVRSVGASGASWNPCC
jgi:hypothetical protein